MKSLTRFACIAIASGIPLAVSAGAGDVDEGFGTDGFAQTDFGTSNEFIRDIALLPDDRIIAVGETTVGPSNDFGITRYTSDGVLDVTFGTAGITIVDIAGGSFDENLGVTLQDDGKPIVAGDTLDGGGEFDAVLVRLTADGFLDASFDGDGIVITDIGPNEGFAATAVQPDGRIVAVGAVTDPDVDFLVARYLANGALDVSFGASGLVITDLGGRDLAGAVAILPDGKILVGGISDGGGDNDFALVRYNSDGTPDPGFGTASRVITDLGGDDFGGSIVGQDDGRIVMGGQTDALGDSDFAAVRYDADGSIDPSFGNLGISINGFTPGFDEQMFKIALQGKRIVQAGWTIPATTAAFAVLRLNSNGTPDTSFGTNGRVVVDFPGPGSDIASTLAIQSDGAIVVGGRTRGPGGFVDFALVRLLGFGISFGITGSWFNSLWNGQGWSLEVVPSTDPPVLVAYNFTYPVMAPAGKGGGGVFFGNQMWLQGSGPIDGDTAVVALQRPIEGFFDNPTVPLFQPWGIATFTFNPDCVTGTVNIVSDVDDVDDTYPITRITPDVLCQ